jgi:hypothetical protein
MYGLSCTAIGMRDVVESLTIYNKLTEPLRLSYLELAIGVPVDISTVFKLPIAIHHNCLHKIVDNCAKRIDYRKDFDDLHQFIKNNNVLFMSLHPNKDEDFEQYVLEMSEVLNIPIYVETMYHHKDAYNSLETIGSSKLLVDVSHINIWTNGNDVETERIVLYLLDNYDVGEIHLSHNNGYKDSHQLVPDDIWFYKHLPEWSDKYFVTWESLPKNFSQYKRLQ